MQILKHAAMVAVVFTLVICAPISYGDDNGRHATREDSSGPYTVKGDFSQWFLSGTVVMSIKNPNYDREKWRDAKQVARESNITPDQAFAPYTELGREPLSEGIFEFSGETAKPLVIQVAIKDGTGRDGKPLGAMMGSLFILEAGELSISMGPSNRLDIFVDGGYYSNIIFRPYMADPDWLGMGEEAAAIRKAWANRSSEGKAIDKEKEDERNKQLNELYTNRTEIEQAVRKKVATMNEDPLARELAVKSAGYARGPWLQEAYYEIIQLDPDNTWARKGLKSYNERAAKQSVVDHMTHAVNFEAVDLKGDKLALNDALAKSRYVLLEFWASWCGPCRIEIPNMKEDYARYNSKGFEIFSYTIDDWEEDWEEASSEEDFPWYDSGYGNYKEPTRLYNVSGVPLNFLIDSQSGEIVARNLRGTALSNKLSELLD